MEKEPSKLIEQQHNTEGGLHSYDAGELKAFIEFINDCLKLDPDVSPNLPIKTADDLVVSSKDGIMLCKLINVVSHGVIDERTINKKKPMSIYKMTENLTLAINASMAIGCRIVNITPQSIMDGKIHLIMGMVWQVMRMYLFEGINLSTNPGIILLAEEGETMEDLLKLSSEKILVRWLNRQLKAAGQPPKVKEINTELKDMEVFSHVMGQLDESFDKSVLEGKDTKKMAHELIESSKRLGIKSFIDEDALLEGNSKIYLMFTSLLFNAKSGLNPTKEKKTEETNETESNSTEKKEEVEKVKIAEETTKGTREERSYQLWINSLGLDNTYVNDLYPDLQDGLVILKIINTVWPGSVVDGKYEKTPGKNKYKMIGNGNYAIEICKSKNIRMAGISGAGLADSNPLQVKGIMWQLMRANSLQIIGGKTEEELLSLANRLVNKKPDIKSFKDPVLKDSRFLIDLLACIDPDIIDWEIVTPGKEDKDIEDNAKYCISIARKLGAKIFMTWEDIKEVFYLK